MPGEIIYFCGQHPQMKGRSRLRPDKPMVTCDERNRAAALDGTGAAASGRRLISGALVTGGATDAEDIVQDASVPAFSTVRLEHPRLLAVLRDAAYTWLAKNRPSAVVLVDRPTWRCRRASRPSAGRWRPRPPAAKVARTGKHRTGPVLRSGRNLRSPHLIA
jgi:hypothetical protein